MRYLKTGESEIDPRAKLLTVAEHARGVESYEQRTVSVQSHQA